jgi:hypothetical protein
LHILKNVCRALSTRASVSYLPQASARCRPARRIEGREGRGQVLGALEAAGRVLLEQAQDDRLDGQGDVGAQIRRRPRVLGHGLTRSEGTDGLSNGTRPTSISIEDDPERVEIAAPIDGQALGLLRRQVTRGAEHHAGRGERGPVGLDCLRADLKRDIEEFRADLKRDIKELETRAFREMKDLEYRMTIKLRALMVIGHRRHGYAGENAVKRM